MRPAQGIPYDPNRRTHTLSCDARPCHALRRVYLGKPHPNPRCEIACCAAQVVDNFIAGKSEGVSGFFIMIWLIGDSFNIVGCLLAQAVRRPPATRPLSSPYTRPPRPSTRTRICSVLLVFPVVFTTTQHTSTWSTTPRKV